VDGRSAGDLVSAGGGTGTTDAAGAGVVAGAGVAEAAGAGLGDGLAAGEGAGDCASAAPASAIATIGMSAAMAARKVLIRIISGILHPTPGGAACPTSRPPGRRYS
jgi:hypothetical protein